jgi:RNA polymerase sigma-70 factor (ECF subfamily)
VLAATVRVTRDLDLAEECAQDAFVRALETWGRDGIPDRPAAWLTTTARRRALDHLRRGQLWRKAAPLLVEDRVEDGPERVVDELHQIPDDRLRLICTCCHPALGPDAQVALTLRLVCGLSTAEVARSFLVRESTMAARITRAKKKIAGARIPYRVPTSDELPGRLDGVRGVIHLLFTTGHTAPAGADLMRVDLMQRAIDLCRMLRALAPDDPETAGLLGLLLLNDARRATRVDTQGRLLLLADQDRSRWDAAQIREGLAATAQALHARPRGRMALQAAIAAAHATAATWEATDWATIVTAYDELLRLWPSPVVALNRAAAIGIAAGPQAGLQALDELRDVPQLAGYSYAAAARADFLAKLGRRDEAALAYEEASLLTENTVERDFLAERLAALHDPPAGA